MLNCSVRLPCAQLQGEDEMFDKVFADADKDKSGKISYDEFKAIFVKLVKAGDELKKR